MLFMAEMTVRIPSTLAPEVADEIKRKEKEYAQQLQRNGQWRHLWRVVGEYANVSIFDVSGNDELHTILSGLPLFPYMEIKVTPLANHPSSIVQE
ncbi:muconolactone Delta-isomerase [Acidovorax sp. Leaf160]|uniref:muconolactone Delta-isomerase n=1 Tax=Acidovorax sp. Leaf160 TaxID=1736280 RepID=UPI0006F2DF3C|nr:muconolactone Delta-isomerase [Acidovorax sp. Leaf160]KQR60779.1 muconolactone delta-isomerase [Acidovorax sp. Leaf160]